MSKWTSVILMIIILVASLAGCGGESAINEDAQAFLEETEGISSETSETSNVDELDVSNGERNDKPPLDGPPENHFGEDMPDIRVAIPKGLSAVSMLGAMNQAAQNDRSNVEYDIIEAADLLSMKPKEKVYDVMLLPTNLAASYYNKGAEYKLLGTILWGSQYIVSNEDLSDWSELKSKSIVSFGEGQASDVVLKYVMAQNGLQPGENVEITYVSKLSDLTPQFVKGRSKVAVFSEPTLSNVFARKEDTFLAFDIQEEWEKLFGSMHGYPQVSVVVSNDLIDQYPFVIGWMMQSLVNSTIWVNEETTEAAEFGEALDIGLRRKMILNAVERSNIYFVPAHEAKADIETYLTILNESSKKLIGGQLPDEEFYFIPPRR